MAAGVPQVLLAFGYDRPDNATRLERLGVGKYLPPGRWVAEEIAAVLEGLTKSAEVKQKCDELSRKLRSNRAAAAAAVPRRRRAARRPGCASRTGAVSGAPRYPSSGSGGCHTRRVFERFTEPARQVVVYAQDEARSLKHNYIGTEHLLLGLLRVEDGLALRVLASLGVDLEEVRDQVVAVLCFETDVERCHRKVIIDEVVGATEVPVAALPA